MSEAEAERIVAGQPYTTVEDFWNRALPSRPIAEKLVLTGGFDTMYGIGSRHGGLGRRGAVTRRDLLLHIAELDRWKRSVGRASRGGIRSRSRLDLGDAPQLSAGSGLPEMSRDEQVRAELEILGLDVAEHVVAPYGDLLTELGVVPSRELLGVRSRSEVLVAGTKVATQTPPVRSGKRVVFCTLDDPTGPVDATFFEDAQAQYAPTVFHSWLLLIRGEVRRTGPRGVSVRATGAWDLEEVRALWRAGGSEAVHALVSAPSAALSTSPPHQDLDGSENGQQAGPAAGPAARARRVLVHPTGYRRSPYSDVGVPGENVRESARKLWHSSPGSSGR